MTETVAVGTISHESNTFAPGETTLEEFTFVTDKDVIDSFAAGRSIQGIIDVLTERGYELHPTVGATALPGPTVAEHTYERIVQAFLDRCAGVELAGVCLDLHGSMVAEGTPDAEGAFLRRLRDVVGPDVPIAGALDMHATITEPMIETLDAITGYRTAPHTDVVETGERAARLLHSSVATNRSFRVGWEPLPMLLAGERSETDAAPMTDLIDSLPRTDPSKEIANVDYFLGFPWADSPHAGCHAVITGGEAAHAAVQATAREYATAFWDCRDTFDFTTEAHQPAAALREAAQSTVRPVVIAETGDIPGAGGTQDLTGFLATIVGSDDVRDAVVAAIVDNTAVSQCMAAGEGATVQLALGRHYPETDPFECTGTVRTIHIDGPIDAVRLDIGSTAVILVDERSNYHRDPDFLSTFDLPPEEQGLIVLKSGYLSPAWKDVAARRLFALTRGYTDQVLARIPYERVPRPIYPIDENATWP